MPSVKLKKVGNSFEKLLQPILALDNEKVQVGHFQEQGQHYSGYSYPELMQIHHNGGDPTGETEIVPRPVLDYLFANNYTWQDPKFNKALKAWGRREPSQLSNQQLLDDIGELLAKKEKEIFGMSPPLAPNSPSKGRNTPLIAEGDLKSKVAHKNTITNTIKEV